MANRRLRRVKKSKKKGGFSGANLSGKSRTNNSDFLKWYNG
tara:strand:+ start:1298 stop:1420 length:123 start_codon:yes stop_codon:yes gene_type:complete